MPAGRFRPPVAPRQAALQKAVKLAPGQTVGFRPGRGYYASGGAAAARPPVDPLVPLSGAAIANRIAGYTAKLPAPLTDAQIQSRAASMVDPVVARLTKSATDQGRAASGAISGYANSLANSLAAYNPQANYATAEQGQAAADAAESGAIRGTGTELASQLAGKLAGLQGPAGLDAATSGVVSAAGAGGANATLGTGSAALAQLLAAGTAAQSEAGKQPGIARSQGMADIRDVTMAGNKTLADQVAAATGQLPGIVSGLRDQSATRQSNRAQAGQTLRTALEGRNISLAQFNKARNDALDIGVTKQVSAATKAAATKAAQDARASAKVTAAQVAADAKVTAAKVKADAAAAGKGPGGTKPAVIASANRTALSIISKAAKVTVTTAGKGSGGPFGGTAGKTTKRSVVPPVGGEAYYRAIHQAEAAIEPLLPDWTPGQITSFVQRLANRYFKG